MGYWTSVRLKIINFFKKNRKIIFVALIIWLIIIIINYILKNQPQKLPEPSTTYTPHVSVMNSNQEVPEKYQKPIENLIDTYFNYCNNGEYERAYNLITEDCRKKNYPTLEEFVAYINKVFEGKKKIYNIQSYSIVDNKYIYNIRILDDILANGTTDGYYYYEEKIVLIEENGEMKLSIAEYIGDENPNVAIEDDYIKVEVTNKSVDYETETYTLKITNKTDNYIVIADNTQTDEMVLDLGKQTRTANNSNLAFFFVSPNGMRNQQVTFNKYFDDGMEAQKIILSSVRVLKDYDWMQGTTEEQLNNAVKVYQLEIPLN